MRRASARPGAGHRPVAPADHRCRHARPRLARPTPVDGRAGATVPFSYPAAPTQHYVEFTSGPTPTCTPGVPMPAQDRALGRRVHVPPRRATYEFICPSTTCRRTRRCAAPSASVAPTPTPTPDASATPQPGASPTPAPTAGARPPSRRRRSSSRSPPASAGTRVRGRGRGAQAASRLEVTLTARPGRASDASSARRARRGRGRVLGPARREGRARAAQPQAPRRDRHGRADAAGRTKLTRTSEGATARLASMGCAASSSCSPPVSRCAACGETPRPATEPRVSSSSTSRATAARCARRRVEVRGTVTPADAAVRVGGRGRARSAAASSAPRSRSHPGGNVIDVTATAPGPAPRDRRRARRARHARRGPALSSARSVDAAPPRRSQAPACGAEEQRGGSWLDRLLGGAMAGLRDQPAGRARWSTRGSTRDAPDRARRAASPAAAMIIVIRGRPRSRITSQVIVPGRVAARPRSARGSARSRGRRAALGLEVARARSRSCGCARTGSRRPSTTVVAAALAVRSG